MRRPVGEHDIKIQIAHCGICHSDLHQIHNDWKNSIYPMVPGYATWDIAGAKLHCSGVRLRYLPVHLAVCGMHCVYLHGRDMVLVQ